MLMKNAKLTRGKTHIDTAKKLPNTAQITPIHTHADKVTTQLHTKMQADKLRPRASAKTYTHSQNEGKFSAIFANCSWGYT